MESDNINQDDQYSYSIAQPLPESQPPPKPKYIPPQLRGKTSSSSSTYPAYVSPARLSTSNPNHVRYSEDWSTIASQSIFRERDQKPHVSQITDERIYGEYVDPDIVVTLESVEMNIMYGLKEKISNNHLIYIEEKLSLVHDHTAHSKTVVSCAHKVKGKKLVKGCALCLLEYEARGKLRLYLSNMHNGTNGRDKIFRWRCEACGNDLF